MKREEARIYARSQLGNYLRSKGINPAKPFRCLNPAHEDRHPSMSFKGEWVHCFACGATMDIFSLVSAEFNITGREMFDKTYQLLNIEVEDSWSPAVKAGAGESPVLPVVLPEQETTDFHSYFSLCASRAFDTDYFLNCRGLSAKTVRRFGLGYDPQFSRSTGGQQWQAVIIPTGRDSYVARNTDPGAVSRNRYRKVGSSAPFNIEALREADSPVFVVEGEFDAISICEVGGLAVALGSTANVDAFLREIRENPPSQALMLALDADDAGEKATRKLQEGLQQLNIRCQTYNPYGGCKDASEALLTDRERFAGAIAAAADFEKMEERVRLARESSDYRLSYGVQSFLDDFLKEISENSSLECIPTGFKQLDLVHDGGLYAESLNIIGAIASIGKTSFVQQMADQIAEAGRDVLIVSLEMSKKELVSRSLSRLTLLQELGASRRIRMAKSARDIMTGEKYEAYSDDELMLIQAALKRYEAVADRVYIVEGSGDIGVDEVRSLVERHIRLTGNRPVLLVDYLQILSAAVPRGTERQNVDYSVTGLKRIARDFRIPVICVSAFNRAAYSQSVSLADFRESSTIEYSADVVWALQLEGAGGEAFNVDAAKRRDPRSIELVVLKNRNGRTGDTLKFQYYPRYNYFAEI